jgi:transcriptional regulator with XRE-family HTH domain
MSITIDLLDALKASHGGVSDYKAAKLLGVSQPTMSKYRNGDLPMSPERIIMACQLANLNPLEWLLRLHLERARCTPEKDLWNLALDSLPASAAKETKALP